MYSPRSQANHGADGVDAKKFDANAGQWMREALESRQVIEELKAKNDKLQRDVYGLNAKINLMYECCGDLGIVDRLGDLMQRKVREFQAAQAARNAPAASGAAAAQQPANLSPRTRKRNGLGFTSFDEGFICGSSTFQDGAGFFSSHKGQVARTNFHRMNMFEAEEAKLRNQLNIFGVPKLPLQSDGSFSTARDNGDTIDNLLSTAEATASPAKSARHEGNVSTRQYSSVSAPAGNYLAASGDAMPSARSYDPGSYR